MPDIKPLDPERLYHPCDLSGLDFTTTAELEGAEVTLGQERVLEAISFGVGIAHEGYNLYVMGSPGVGRHRVVRDILSRFRGQTETHPYDWVYVNNFDMPHKPRSLSLPTGQGREFKRDLDTLVQDLLADVSASLRSDEFKRRAEEINADFKAREKKASKQLEKNARDQGIALVHTSGGVSLVPLRDDKVISADEFEALPGEEKEHIEEVVEHLKDEVRDTFGQIPEWMHEMHQRFRALEREVAELTINGLLDVLSDKYIDHPEVVAFLDRLRADVLENVELFRGSDESDGQPQSADDPRFNRYKANLLVDNSDGPAMPIIYEANPTYQNLLGRVEHMSRHGTLATDFTLIKAGALHRANDGFLILDAEKILTNAFAWDALKRTLAANEIRIESLERQLSLLSTISLEPEPIPANVKVILIGDRYVYHLLKAYEPEFSHLFKVVADFAETLPRREQNDQHYARMIATLQQQEKLLPLERDAVERVIEQCARRAEDGERLSLQMAHLVDLLKEADYWARDAGVEQVSRLYVQQAIDQQEFRISQYRERLQEEIVDGTLMIDTSGIQLGRVNGLSVIQLGDHAFGLPSRISATARLGSGEVLDIEREVDQGGPLHSKGVYILSAYLNRRYARYQPLSVTATLVFEQTYAQVEGDSASAGELCALLSALGDLPIRQSLAITGSVNQHGEVQPIGGVNEKIEGFFDICNARGLTGEQGVIIPKGNMADLMLKEAVRAAAREERFHIYAVQHVEQAMELLTGYRAGVANDEGIYPEDSLNGRIQQRLAEWFALRIQVAEIAKGGSDG